MRSAFRAAVFRFSTVSAAAAGEDKIIRKAVYSGKPVHQATLAGK
jgi:hypothetical protein